MAALFFVLGVSENALHTIHSWCSIKLAQHFKWLKSLCPTHSLFKYTVQGGYSNQRPGTCYLNLLRRRVNARNVSYTPYPTGDKHTISTLLIKPIFSVLAHAEKTVFFKASLRHVTCINVRSILSKPFRAESHFTSFQRISNTRKNGTHTDFNLFPNTFSRTNWSSQGLVYNGEINASLQMELFVEPNTSKSFC